jgi:hypothetical protein
MENMDKGLTVPKWVLMVRPKIPQMPQNLSAKFVCPSFKVLDFNEERLYWVSVVREPGFCCSFHEIVATFVQHFSNGQYGCTGCGEN